MNGQEPHDGVERNGPARAGTRTRRDDVELDRTTLLAKSTDKALRRPPPSSSGQADEKGRCSKRPFLASSQKILLQQSAEIVRAWRARSGSDRGINADDGVEKRGEAGRGEEGLVPPNALPGHRDGRRGGQPAAHRPAGGGREIVADNPVPIALSGVTVENTVATRPMGVHGENGVTRQREALDERIVEPDETSPEPSSVGENDEGSRGAGA
jgi:hypothetical protein